ncbi:MAG: hypothetical protein ACN6Q8_06230 [Stenotrophomonas sp.]
MTPLNAEMSVDEMISTLKKSRLPTIIIEGSDDIVVYRHFEDRLSQLGASIFPVGGRDKLISIFKRRAEITETSLVFVADKDYYVHTGVPEEFIDQSFVFTDGYSVENDVFRDGQLLGLLRGNEREIFQEELEIFIEWYALEMSRLLSGKKSAISLHPDNVLLNIDNLTTIEDGEEYPNELKLSIFGNYQSMLRGKSLLPLIVRRTSIKGRNPKHNTLAMLEMVATRPGVYLERIFEGVRNGLGVAA